MMLTIHTLFNDPNIVNAVIQRVLKTRKDTIYWQQYLGFRRTTTRVFKDYIGQVTGVMAGSINSRYGEKPIRERRNIGSGYGEIVGSLLMTGAASVKNKDDNAGGIDLLNIDLPFKFIKPDTEDKDYFVTYLQQKLNELKSIYGTFPKMIMSRGTFIKNIIGSSEFGDKFKMQLTGNEMYMSTGLITSQLASTIFTGIGLPAIEIKEDYVVDQTGKNIPIYADGRISLLPQDKIGYMRFHTPYEAVDGVPGRNYTQADGDMLISGYKDGNGRYLEYTAEWIPQIANPNLIVNFDLSEMNA